MVNKNTVLKKRELCYFISANNVNYIYKKRLLGKIIKIKIVGDVYFERTFRFVRVFTDKDLHIKKKKICFVARREHSKNAELLMSKGNLHDYNKIMNENKNIKQWHQFLKETITSDQL